MKIFNKILINIAIYLTIVVATVWGLPRLLVYLLDTPYPMASITSGSMWPALKEGDLVFIQGVSRTDLSEGDIIVFRNGAGGTFTIHRIVELRENEIITKGDANFNNDELPVQYRDVVGRNLELFGAPFHIPYLGSVTVWANNK
jgi:signal peptidase I